jgi:acid phosphatase type 7
MGKISTPFLYIPFIIASIVVTAFNARGQELRTKPEEASLVFIQRNSEWKFNDKGKALEKDWVNLFYNDSDWPEGKAELGFGDGDEQTILAKGHITYFFRNLFFIEKPENISQLELSILKDDGCIAYINGQEVMRSNMPDGPVSNSTFAKYPVFGEAENAWHSQLIGPSILVAGMNIIAVEVHQSDSVSSDISFNLLLREAKNMGKSSSLLARGPYLQQASENSIIIRWRTSVASASIVKFGTSPDNLDKIISKAALTKDHSIEIKELRPTTKYYYSIETSDAILQRSNENFFVTHPPKGAKDAARFWIIGDSGTNHPEQNEVRDAFYSYNGNRYTSGFILLGDNAYENGTDSEYQWAFFRNHYENILKQTPVWPCPGNHDLYSANSLQESGPYYDIFTLPKNGESGGVPSGSEAYYSFDYGNIHFISLDSETNELRDPEGPMVKWLEQDLKRNMLQWVVVFFHHPPYSKGAHNTDWQIQSVDIRKVILPILDKYHVDIVLCGHTHVYERSYLLKGHYGTSTSLEETMIISKETGSKSDPFIKNYTQQDGIVYVNGGVSGSLKKPYISWPHQANLKYTAEEHGSLILDVHADTLEVKFLTKNKVIWDEFRIVKSYSKELANPASQKEEPALEIFPNPSEGIFRIKIQPAFQAAVLNISRLNGSRIIKRELSGKEEVLEIDLSREGKGMYIIEVKGEKGALSHRVMVH